MSKFKVLGSLETGTKVLRQQQTYIVTDIATENNGMIVLVNLETGRWKSMYFDSLVEVIVNE